ncbi:hypothetical protein ACFWY5_29680 [Nonomuraea sp. NPDC059007]|uniref:hypothetical protein n=1 Tax=Nonomuraea sp. NPDC059007 TaxID=3346692 RepID=UPI0036798E6E
MSANEASKTAISGEIRAILGERFNYWRGEGERAVLYRDFHRAQQAVYVLHELEVLEDRIGDL